MIIEDIIEIDAAKEVLWAVTLDLNRWDEWNPNIETITRMDDGEVKVGSRALLKSKGMPKSIWTVIHLVDQEYFGWTSKSIGIHFKAGHRIEALQHGVASVLRVEMAGLVARILWPLLKGQVAAAIQRENQGLKRRCETMPV